MGENKKPFWKVKTLDEMTRAEWESLCDGCARCCLEKLTDEGTGRVFYTSVACSLLDTWTCRCIHYKDRFTRAPDCLVMVPEMLEKISWLPMTCAYRLLFEGADLAWWHPLVSGRAETVHEAGISVRDKVISGAHVSPDLLEAYIIEAKI